jgi:(1->4)-alpha-D-glucan 1-alpha-D-glucosylmutase
VRRRPSSTYRLQLTPQFNFRDAAALVPYLRELGISDLYISPPFAAMPGSTHGYDVVDHNRLRDELGGAAGYAELCRAVAAAGMGQLVDFVPNHMGVGPCNAWWIDVLENGPSSVYAPFFDVDWSPIKRELANKVLVPVLGDQFGEVLERGELHLKREGGAFFFEYWEHRFPVAPRAVPRVIGHRLEQLQHQLGRDDVQLQELQSIITALEKLAPRDELDPEKIAERAREKEVAKRRLAALFSESSPIGQFVDENVRLFNGVVGEPRSFDLLEQLLDAQAYRLAHWRVAGESINYRRFFDINSLAAIRMEDARVFAATHALVFQLLREGKITGLRIDHPDGLYAPTDYFRQLRLEIPELYVVVEKILEGHEPMPSSWQVDGTTGYEFLNMVNGLFVDARHQVEMTAFYQRFTGVTQPFAELVYDMKKRLMSSSMASQLSMLAQRLSRLAEGNRRTRDFTLNALAKALVELIARLPIYRTYIGGERTTEIEPRDRMYIERTVAQAKRGLRDLNPSILDFMRAILLLEDATLESLEFVRKLQQLTGAITAKAIEDTTFYVYNRLVSLNEVGGDPQKFGVAPSLFHHEMALRRRDWPGSLNTTATHDTKRGEDVRLRIDALSEIPDEWAERVQRWSERARPWKRELEGEPAPDANDELLVYQTLVGTFPDDGQVSDEYRSRIAAYLQKAVREAKVHSSWTNVDEAYETAIKQFADRLLTTPEVVEELRRFVARVAAAARLSSLAAVAVKVAAPGVADIYQGTELWDLSLVDPDNRRPVDYAHRRELLATLARRAGAGAEARLGLAREVTTPAVLPDGRAKLLLIREALRFRRAHHSLFLDGDYLPLAIEGEHSNHALAFARGHGAEHLVCVVPRLLLQLLDRAAQDGPGGQPHIAWRGRVLLPAPLRGPFVDVVTGRRSDARDGTLALAELFADFPVALLAS